MNGKARGDEADKTAGGENTKKDEGDLIRIKNIRNKTDINIITSELR